MPVQHDRQHIALLPSSNTVLHTEKSFKYHGALTWNYLVVHVKNAT